MVQKVQKNDFQLSDYVVFDIATSGLSPKDSSLLGIFAIKIENGEIVERFRRIVKLQGELSEFITDLTKITNEMIKVGETEEQVLNDFQVFCGNLTLVAHNAEFEVNFLNYNFQKYCFQALNQPVIDSLALVRKIYPELKRYSLTRFAQFFDFDTNNQNPEFGAETTRMLIEKLRVF
ncbi:TPA: exonuclease domain-containing protein [Streptococcus suis]